MCQFNTFQIRGYRKNDETFVNFLCELSWNLPYQGTGYPRVKNLQELLAEIDSYENKPEDCLYMVFDNHNLIGFYGYLFEPGEDVAFVIGPILQTGYHKVVNYKELFKHIEKESADMFQSLIISVSETNTFLHDSVSLKWDKGYEEIEMNYDVQSYRRKNTHYPLTRLRGEGSNFLSVAKLLASIDGWENPEEDLIEYIRDNGMKVAYAAEDGVLMGAIMWDEMGGTDFWRFEDIAVYKKYRGKGVASNLIHYVLQQAKENGAKSLFLSVEKDNERAYRLYERLGFYETVRTCSYSYFPCDRTEKRKN